MHSKQLVLAALLALLLVPVSQAQPYTAGKDYFTLVPARHTNVEPGKIEVAEIFSYACPFCAQFNPFVEQMKRELPANVQLVLVPASFNASEDWPMFQRATCTAQIMGILDKTHDAMFDAVWKTGELAVADPRTHQLKSPLPTIEDAARFYKRVGGVAVDKFIAASKSFSVDVKMRADDALLIAYQVDSTPTLIVNGKYRISVTSAGGMKEMIAIAKWLVASETK